MVALFRRANLVYFRHTQHSPELLTPAILARAKKRSYANYLYQRTANIWATRDDLLAYEQALELEAEVDALLEGPTSSTSSGTRNRSTISRTPAPTAGRLTTPATPVKGVKATSSPVASRSPRKAPAGVGGGRKRSNKECTRSQGYPRSGSSKVASIGRGEGRGGPTTERSRTIPSWWVY